MKINKIKLILTLLLLLLISIGVIVFTYKQYKKEKTNSLRWEQNYDASNKSNKNYIDLNNQLVTRANEYNFTIKELRRSKSSGDSLLRLAYETINARDAKLRKVEELYQIAIESRNEGTTVVSFEPIGALSIPEDIPAGAKLKYINIVDGFLNEDLIISNDSLVHWDYSYTEEIIIVDNLIRKPNKKGEQVFILFRWLRRWVPVTDISSNNPNSEVVVFNKLNFQRKFRDKKQLK
jgi:hypothetical protein